MYAHVTSPQGSSAAIEESGLQPILTFSCVTSTLIKYPYPNRTCFRRNTSPPEKPTTTALPHYRTHASEGKQSKAEALISEEPGSLGCV
jgi:hypothetical protein